MEAPYILEIAKLYRVAALLTATEMPTKITADHFDLLSYTKYLLSEFVAQWNK